MGYALFDKATGLYANKWTRYDLIPHSTGTHVQIETDTVPDERTDRWDGDTGIRPATAQELIDYDAAKDDDEVLKAFDVSPKDKTILKQIFLLRKVNEPALTQQEFLNELKADYLNYRDA